MNLPFYRRYRGEKEQFVNKNRVWNAQSVSNAQTEGNSGKNNLKGKQPGENLKKPQWDIERLQPFMKNFYVPHVNVTNRLSSTVNSSFLYL